MDLEELKELSLNFTFGLELSWLSRVTVQLLVGHFFFIGVFFCHWRRGQMAHSLTLQGSGQASHSESVIHFGKLHKIVVKKKKQKKYIKI